MGYCDAFLLRLALCTTARQNGKIIQRTEFTAHIEGNARRVAQNPEIHKKRQALVEHPFGTIKRQWGFDHIIPKRGIKTASADFGLIALVYNLRRLFNLNRPCWGLKSSLFPLSRLQGRLLQALISLHLLTYPILAKSQIPGDLGLPSLKKNYFTV
jgi:hypothetical protein